jgi:KDO2-lipid IV(A) lauroyltransferase
MARQRYRYVQATHGFHPLRLLMVGLMRLAAALPLSLVHRFADAVAWIRLRVPNRQRRNSLINISLCYPQWSREQRLQLRDQAVRETSRTFMELPWVWMRPVSQVLGMIRRVSGEEHLRAPRPQGLIVLSPHLGNWEMAGLYLSGFGPTTSMYRPQSYVDEDIRLARERNGANLVPATPGGIKQMLQALRAAEIVGILPDQLPKGDKGAVFAPFFDEPAYTMLLVNRLVRKTGARVVFLFAERLSEGGYHMHCLPASDKLGAEDPTEAAAALNQGVERCIAVVPSQYFWSYRRFRKRPPESPGAIYRGPK